VIIPTREGGGADRNFRAFTSIWEKYLTTKFEPGFYPGASGRVGYEVFMGKAEADCYNLIFGNMGPEVLNWVVKEPDFPLDDYFYFGRVDVDPGCAFVGKDSPFQSIDDIVAEGKKRKLNVGTSRMAHPASIGIMALGDQTGAEFNLIPLSGGKNTIAGAVTGEVDFSVLTSGSVIAKRDSVRTLLVFGDNLVGDRLDNAPTINGHFGMNLPPMLSSRAFAIHRKATEDFPDRYAKLEATFAEAFKDPELLDAYEKSGGTREYLSYGNAEDCATYVKAILEIGAKYKSLISGA
jgi:tripartite-type tricarboxylate transporter receptor subunit TctC